MDGLPVEIVVSGIALVGGVLGYLLRFAGASKNTDTEAAGKLRDQLLKANEQYQLQLQEAKTELDSSRRDYEDLRQENIELGNSLQECLSENIRIKKTSANA